MIIDRITMSKSVETLGEWNKGGVEAHLEPDDNFEECWAKLKEKLNSVLPSVSYPIPGTTYVLPPYNANLPIPVINRANERMELLIANCTTLEQLAALKDQLNPDTRPAYMTKLKELEKKISGDQ